MKTFSIKLKPDFVSDSGLVLKTLNPVCSLMTLYNGPSLAQVKFDYGSDGTETAKGVANEYTFVWKRVQTHAQLEYFLKGELQLKLVAYTDGVTKVELPYNSSPTTEVELRKALLKFEASVASAPLSSKTESDKPEKGIEFQLTETMWETFFELSNAKPDNEKFITAMNQICAALTKSNAPFISSNMLVKEEIQLTHETFIRLEASNTNYAIRFNDYTHDSGGHSYPNGYIYEFLVMKGAGIVLRTSRNGNRLQFETRFEPRSGVEQLIKFYLQGKI